MQLLTLSCDSPSTSRRLLRLVLYSDVCLVGENLALLRPCIVRMRGRVYRHTTTAMNDMSTPPPRTILGHKVVATEGQTGRGLRYTFLEMTIYGKNVMSAQMLAVSLPRLGTGAPSRKGCVVNGEMT